MRKLMPGLVILFSLTVVLLMAASPSSRADDVSTGTVVQSDGTGAPIQSDGPATETQADGTGTTGGVNVSNQPIGQKFPNDQPASDGLDTEEADKGGCCG